MQQVSALYRDLFNDPNHWKETRLAIGEIGVLTDHQGNRLVFGDTTLLLAASDADAGFGESDLETMATDLNLFSKNTPTIGCCVSAEIDVKMLSPPGFIPRQARIVPYVRLTDGHRYSEWIQKGVFFIDTRSENVSSDNLKWLTIHGYDAMLKAETNYPASRLDWPAVDIDVVKEIADAMAVPVDPRTYDLMNKAYPVQYPGEYSQREVLGYIAASYCGCFIMSDLGELLLVTLNNLPKQTSYLVVSENDRRAIAFGYDENGDGVRLLV